MMAGFIWGFLMNVATVGVITLLVYILVHLANPKSSLDYWKLFLYFWCISLIATMVLRWIGVPQFYDRV